MEGTKYDGDKIRFDLIPPEVMMAMGTVFTYGAAKYADRNWENGLSISRVYNALQRHLNAYLAGEWFDPPEREGSGYPHLWHAACCMAMLVALEMRERNVDVDFSMRVDTASAKAQKDKHWMKDVVPEYIPPINRSDEGNGVRRVDEPIWVLDAS